LFSLIKKKIILLFYIYLNQSFTKHDCYEILKGEIITTKQIREGKKHSLNLTMAYICLFIKKEKKKDEKHSVVQRVGDNITTESPLGLALWHCTCCHQWLNILQKSRFLLVVMEKAHQSFFNFFLKSAKQWPNLCSSRYVRQCDQIC
jgi:hypothetical protein